MEKQNKSTDLRHGGAIFGKSGYQHKSPYLLSKSLQEHCLGAASLPPGGALTTAKRLKGLTGLEDKPIAHKYKTDSRTGSCA